MAAEPQSRLAVNGEAGRFGFDDQDVMADAGTLGRTSAPEARRRQTADITRSPTEPLRALATIT